MFNTFWLVPDPDPAYHLDADPNLDPSPTFQLVVDPEPQHFHCIKQQYCNSVNERDEGLVRVKEAKYLLFPSFGRVPREQTSCFRPASKRRLDETANV